MLPTVVLRYGLNLALLFLATARTAVGNEEPVQSEIRRFDALRLKAIVAYREAYFKQFPNEVAAHTHYLGVVPSSIEELTQELHSMEPSPMDKAYVSLSKKLKNVISHSANVLRGPFHPDRIESQEKRFIDQYQKAYEELGKQLKRHEAGLLNADQNLKEGLPLIEKLYHQILASGVYFSVELPRTARWSFF